MAGSTPEPDTTGAVLETRFYRPRWRPGQVPRPRLVERLQRGARSKLILVSAPPGFGKTTLLAEWLAAPSSDERRVAWLSLDQSDDQPATFWLHVLTALQREQPTLGSVALSLLTSPQPPPIASLLALVLNEVAALPRQLVLVLDDYHVIEAGQIQADVAFLLDHLPPQLHLVIASRADPAVPLARLRARGELAEIRAADLRFTADEATVFLNQAMGLQLSAQNVAALEARTEGWIAALQLAALSLHGRADPPGFIAAFSGNDRYILDYLVEEVLQRQPAAVREFLLQTSILDRLNAAVCDAVTGQTGSRARLDALERANLFLVPLDDTRQWYRYHHLFADVLRAHARLDLPERLPALYGRASEWYAENGMQPQAIRCALAGGDFERAASLVESLAPALIPGGQSGQLLEWLAPLPDDLIRARPVLSTYYAFALFGTGAIEAADARLRDAERWLEAGIDANDGRPVAPTSMVVVDQAGFQSLPARIALGRAYHAQALGNVADTVEQARRALELLPAAEHFWRAGAGLLLGLALWTSGDLDAAQPTHSAGVASLEMAGVATLALSAAGDGAELLKARGRLSEARRVYQRSLRLASEYGDAALAVTANLYLGLSELYCEQDDLEAASGYLRRSEALGQQAALPETPYRLRMAQARLRQAHGDLDGALDLLDQAGRLYVRGPLPNVRPVTALKARLWIAQGRLGAATDWAAEQRLSVDDELDYPREFHHITLAKVLVARGGRDCDDGCLDAAGGLLVRLLDAADAGGRTGSSIEILVLQALAYRARGKLGAARRALERALGLAEPEGYIRVFVDEGTPMGDLLRGAVADGVGGAFARRLLAGLDGRLAGEAGPRHPETVSASLLAFPFAPVPPVDSLAEPLTVRELEVLRLVAAGMRNQTIAEHLVISLATVKRHIANAYGKLGVDHRTAAVVRATELRLLS